MSFYRNVPRSLVVGQFGSIVGVSACTSVGIRLFGPRCRWRLSLADTTLGQSIPVLLAIWVGLIEDYA